MGCKELEMVCEMLQGKANKLKKDFSLINRYLTISVENAGDWSDKAHE